MIYLYKTRVYKDLTNVNNVDSTQNTADKTDFEANKSQAIKIDSIQLFETALIVDDDYTTFKLRMTNWSDVNYIERANVYELCILSGSPL